MGDLTIDGFLDSLDALGVPFFALKAGSGDSDNDRYVAAWEKSDPANNAVEREKAHRTRGINGVFGGRVAVLDIDTKNGAEVSIIRASLAAAGVRIYAEVQSPSGGWHFYVAAIPGLRTLHANDRRASLDFPGTEVLATGANAFLPGTSRRKYGGKGYTVVRNDLDQLLADDGMAFVQWVADHTVKKEAPRRAASGTYRVPASGTLDRYVARAVEDEVNRVANAGEGSRNDQLNASAFALGQLVGGGAIGHGMAFNELLNAAHACGLPDFEARRTIDSGMAGGAKNPRGIPERTERVFEPFGPEPDAEEVRIDTDTGEVLDDAAEPVETVEDKVFNASPVLQRIRQAAHSRLVVPWSVLGAVLARVMAEVPPHVVLPPLVGSDASLNLAVGLVAESGGGKSGAMGCASDVVKIGHRYAQDIGPGSGEAIAMAFLERDPETKDNVLKQFPYALLTADEIAQVGMIGARAAQATMAPMMRSMLTGGPVGNSAVDKERTRKLAPNTYRLCVVAGIQPKLADVLLGDDDGGTPQRWVWLPADDPNWSVEPAEWPGSIMWKCPNFGRGDPDGRVRLKVPEELERAVYEARVRKIRREGDALDGHKLLTREKVAAALAILHGEIEISSFWWEISGHVMHRSDATRAFCLTELNQKAVGEHKARGKLDVAREAGAREARSDEAARWAKAVWKVVTSPRHPNAKHGPEDGCSARCITYALRHNKGADRVAAIDTALAYGWISQRGEHYFPGDSQPTEAAA